MTAFIIYDDDERDGRGGKSRRGDRTRRENWTVDGVDGDSHNNHSCREFRLMIFDSDHRRPTFGIEQGIHARTALRFSVPL
jgi:hypothetical protein